ncbi:MAG: SulP family inorganic anion transporter, partial [Candidatus Binatia bacterium]
MGGLTEPRSTLLPSVTAGTVAGIRTLIGATALAALIFSGELAGGLAAGLGALLFSGAILGVVVALTSSYPGTVAQPQDGAAAILAIMGAALVAAMPGEPADRILTTVLVGIAATSILTGLVLVGLGGLRLGSLVRFIPYPVIGGFLAGSGWLFVRGSVPVMTGQSLDVEHMAALAAPAVAMRWLPGLAFAVALLAALRRGGHAFLVPGMLLGATVLFYAVLLALGHTVADARAAGWLLGPFPEGGAWQPDVLLRVTDADWRALAAEIPKMATVALVSVVALLLNSTGLELATRRDIDPNRELAAAGVANLASGLGGGIVGFHALSV